MVAFAQATLPRLTPAQRKVLELRYERHASIAEMAQWLGISVKAVRLRLKLAHARLGIRPLTKRKKHKRRINATQLPTGDFKIDWL